MMTHKMSSCTSFLRAGSDPTSLWSCLVLVLLWFCVLCLFVCFCLFVFYFDGPLTGLCIGPLQRFEAIDV